MRRMVMALGWIACVSLGSCASDLDDEEGPPLESIEQEVGGKFCITTDDCPDHLRCTTEDGDCQTPPRCAHGPFVCPAVCFGVCQPDHQDGGEPCGPVTCGEGLVCCNESCGICTEPGGFCIQIFCE